MNMKKNITYPILLCVILILLFTIILVNNSLKTNVSDYDINEDIIREELINKINIMSADDMLVDLYSTDFNKDTIDHKLVLTGILLSIEEDGALTIEESDELYNKINICTNTDYINLKSIETMIKKIYGNMQIDYKSILENSNFYYDNKMGRIYSLCISDMNKNHFIDTYIYDFEINDKESYVYVSVAFCKEMLDDSGINIEIYKDYKYKNLYKIYPDEEYFILDENNYKEFSLFKYTFKRNSDDYYFYSLQQIKK